MTIRINVFVENTALPHRVEVVYEIQDDEGNWKETKRMDILQGSMFSDYIWDRQRIRIEEVKA